jgi:hypothetical protein
VFTVANESEAGSDAYFKKKKGANIFLHKTCPHQQINSGAISHYQFRNRLVCTPFTKCPRTFLPSVSSATRICLASRPPPSCPADTFLEIIASLHGWQQFRHQNLLVHSAGFNSNTRSVATHTPQRPFSLGEQIPNTEKTRVSTSFL